MSILRYCGIVSVVLAAAIAGAHQTEGAQPPQQGLNNLLLNSAEVEKLLRHGPWPPPRQTRSQQ